MRKRKCRLAFGAVMVAMLVMTACGQKEDKTGKDKNSMEGENNITATTTTGVEPTKAAETTPTSEATRK